MGTGRGSRVDTDLPATSRVPAGGSELDRPGTANVAPPRTATRPALPPLPRLLRLGLPVLVLAGGLLVWEGVVRAHIVAPYLLPAPRLVCDRWLHLARDGVLWHHTRATLREALLGFLLAFVVGVSFGYLLARWRFAEDVLEPYVALTQAMPVIAFAPLLVVWFGLGLLPKVIICALIVFFPILVNTVAGLKSIDRTMLLAARGLGASRWRVLWRIEVPLALRTLLGGVKMGLTLSMTGAIVAEFVASDAGLGYLMNFGRSAYDTPTVFAASLTMAGLATMAFVAVSVLERVLIRWQ